MRVSIHGVDYEPVRTDAILRAIREMEPVFAEDLGDRLWPHLAGSYPSRGGPTSAYVQAARFLGKLRAKKLVYQRFETARKGRWVLTPAGRKAAES